MRHIHVHHTLCVANVLLMCQIRVHHTRMHLLGLFWHLLGLFCHIHVHPTLSIHIHTCIWHTFSVNTHTRSAHPLSHTPSLTPHTSSAICACTHAHIHIHIHTHTYTHTSCYLHFYMHAVCHAYIRERERERERETLGTPCAHFPLNYTHSTHLVSQTQRTLLSSRSLSTLVGLFWHSTHLVSQTQRTCSRRNRKIKSQIQVWPVDRGGRRVRDPRERQRIRPLRSHLPGLFWH
jgi:hypothetical protein